MFGINPISDSAISDISLLGITGYIYVTDSNDTASITASAIQPTGTISATDENDTATIDGTVVANNIDMHDGLKKHELKRIREIQKQLLKQEQERNRLKVEKAKARKNAIADLVDPKPVVKKTITVPIEKKEKIIEINIAQLQAEKEAILQSIIQRQEIARLQMELVIANAKMAAERDDEEALLLLL